MRKFFRFTFAAAMLVLFLFVVLQLVVIEESRRAMYDAGDVPVSDVIVVLGASVLPSGRPSDILADRLTVAADLYAAGKAGTVLVSGDNGQNGYDEVNAMRLFLLDAGVAPEDVFLDHAGFDTYDSMYRARDVFGVRRAIVVTQEFHLPRALFISSHLGIDAVGVAADLQPYVKQEWFAVRESVANVKAALNLLTGARPAYLGDPVDLTGDGRATWDQP